MLIDGKVITMNPLQPLAEAVAIRGTRIVRVGTTEEASFLIGKDTKIVYLDWGCVVPGFIDTHIHVGDYARYLMWVNLTGSNSIKEMQRRLAQSLKRTPKGKWVVGRGWDEKLFEEKRVPTRFDLDAVAPENPVIFYCAAGPVAVVNSKALQLAGISKSTRAHMGGTVDKTPEEGEPTGILRDAATDLAWNKVPEPTAEELVEAAATACEKIVAAGITSIHWLATSQVDLQILRSLCKSGKLPLRVYMVVPLSFLDRLGSFEGLGEEAARVGGAEVCVDGYLAMRTAALSKPYKGTPPVNAALLCTQTELQTSVGKIADAGFQAVAHAMGDKAVDAALKVFEALPQGRRNRIDPAALLNQELIKRVKQQQVVVSVQPLVAASEFQVYSAVEALGEDRARWLYPLKTLLKRGICVCGGSDCPMEPLNPLLGIQSLVTREFFPDEQLSVNEALSLYTVNAAYASGEENLKGSIEEGKLADFTVLSRDPREVPPNEITGITVELTVVGGKVVYSR